MKTLTIEKFNKIPVGRRVKVYAPEVSDKAMEGRIESNPFLRNHYVELKNGEEIFAYDIKGIWGIDENGNREEL